MTYSKNQKKSVQVYEIKFLLLIGLNFNNLQPYTFCTKTVHFLKTVLKWRFVREVQKVYARKSKKYGHNTLYLTAFAKYDSTKVFLFTFFPHSTQVTL